MSTKFAVLFWTLVLVFGLAACAYSEMDTTYDTEAEALPPSMFVSIKKGDSYRVVYQKETKVMYVVSYGDYNRGTFTLLVDENGDPMLYEGE